MNNFLVEFHLNPDIIHLNHGSFGACPKTVLQELFNLQLLLEQNPMEILSRQMLERMQTSRKHLAEYLNCNADDVVYFPNPTTAMNMVSRSIPLETGDEILTTNHEYGALNRTWSYVCRKKGAKYISLDIPAPFSDKELILDTFKQVITPKTRYIYLSHITSETALILPAKELIDLAHEHGLTAIIDGAHAPSQIDLDLEELGADIYTGACHKWLCSPKGTAFLFAQKSIQSILDPLVVSWGYESDYPSESQYVDYHEWQGTRDISPFLAVPKAIEFQQQNKWARRREECRNLVNQGLELLTSLAGIEPIYTDTGNWHSQMAVVELKTSLDRKEIQSRLLKDYRIEAPVQQWKDKKLMRFSIQAYNSIEDLEALAKAITAILKSGNTYD